MAATVPDTTFESLPDFTIQTCDTDSTMQKSDVFLERVGPESKGSFYGVRSREDWSRTRVALALAETVLASGPGLFGTLSQNEVDLVKSISVFAQKGTQNGSEKRIHTLWKEVVDAIGPADKLVPTPSHHQASFATPVEMARWAVQSRFSRQREHNYNRYKIRKALYRIRHGRKPAPEELHPYKEVS